ncbi:MAG: hypothetical protein EON90_13295 [Brevundimonas sp.]|nr:MAG: hypothetical protein EON90_13295 [Brevundimonas sp.]
MAGYEEARIAREDIAPPVGRRMIVRCERPGCGHAALVDQRRVFGHPREWPRAGRCHRFRCICGSRESQIDYTRDAYAPEGPIHPDALKLWF